MPTDIERALARTIAEIRNVLGGNIMVQGFPNVATGTVTIMVRPGMTRRARETLNACKFVVGISVVEAPSMTAEN